jgi:hypothetical protein
VRDFETWWLEFVFRNNMTSLTLREVAEQAWQSCQDENYKLYHSGKQLVGVHYEPQEFHEGQP